MAKAILLILVALSTLGAGLGYAAFEVGPLDDAAPEGGAAAAPGPAPPAANPPLGRWKLWLTLLLALLFTGILSAAWWLRIRRDRILERAPRISDSDAPLAFACPACGKRLKNKTAGAGQKVKCPQCGNAVLVPSPAADEAPPVALIWLFPLALAAAAFVVALSACLLFFVQGVSESDKAATAVVQKAVEKVRVQDTDLIDVRKFQPAIRDRDLGQFTDLPRLRRLVLDDAPITDEGMKTIGTLTRLESLAVCNTLVTDAGLASLQNLTRLEKLRLDKLRITDAGLAYAKAFPKLKHLSLWRTDISDAGLASLKSLPVLEHLSLDETGVSDAGLKELYGLSSLRYLTVWRTKVSDKGVQELKKALPQLKVNR
jgi:DNA-directed RNA polymerase subunit RPC12/RpoP